MNRRQFIRNSLFSALPLALNGIPLSVWASPFNHILKNNNTNDKVLVFIQLHGGNDGLNTVVPISNYSDYYNLRANIAVPYSGKRKYITLDESLPDEQQIGLHPDMLGAKRLYDNASMAVVQNVGYQNTNLSHFRARDIFFMGGSYDDYFGSGWMGRFLNEAYPGYPENYPSTEMPDPLALEMGNAASLALHRENGIPTGVSLNSPEGFYNLVSGVGGNSPQEFPDNYYGNELEYLMNFELKTNEYAERIQEVYNAGSNSAGVDYPTFYPFNCPPQYTDNSLSEQLKIVARLLSGGSKTRMFLVRLGGFDTHAEQVEAFDSSMGRHSALLYHVSESVRAFFDDLKAQGMDDKVVAMTYSEFGRRAYSNAGYGSDHGKAGPVLLWGPGLKGGVWGNNPDLNDLDNGNLRFTVDYRQVYASVLKDWFGASDEEMLATRFGDWTNQRLDLFEGANSLGDILPEGTYSKLYSCYPNPVSSNTVFSFYLHRKQSFALNIYSGNGKLLKQIAQGEYLRGKHEITANLSDFPAGRYIYTLITGGEKVSKQLIKL